MGWSFRWSALLLSLFRILFAVSGSSAQDEVPNHGGSHIVVSAITEHHGDHHARSEWEGSAAGIAYSERNHHIAGLLVLLMGLAELSHALRLSSFQWARFLLPAAMTGTGLFLLIWSDHEAWPIGSMSFMQTFLGHDPEIVQHKAYGILALVIGGIELIRRPGLAGHAGWATPLPLMAIVGGVMLFGHSHGDHPSAHKIALHHAVMGTIALTAGSSKLLAGWLGKTGHAALSRWEILWACLILVISAQLLIYSE
jgi:putative copper resistance protein D